MKNQSTILILGTVIVIAIATIMFMQKCKKTEKFVITSKITTDLESILKYINSSDVDYNKYVAFLLTNNLVEPMYMEQSFYFGITTLKKFNMATIENISKLA